MSFKEWLKEYGPKFWTLLSLAPISQQDLRDDFVEIALHVRSRFQQKRRFTSLEASKLFWSLWLKQQRKGAERSLWQERLLTFGLFKLGLSLEELSFLTDKHPSKLRFEVSESLKKDGRQLNLISPPLVRDCSRVDLNVVDALMGLQWPDPLNLFGPNDFHKHCASCSRCQRIWHCMKSGVEYLHQIEASSMPESVINDLLADVLEAEKTARSENADVSSGKKWPSYIKYPVQAVSVVVILFVIVRLPTLHDLALKGVDVSKKYVVLPLKETTSQVNERVKMSVQDIKNWADGLRVQSIEVAQEPSMPEENIEKSEEVVLEASPVATPPPKTIAQNTSSPGQFSPAPVAEDGPQKTENPASEVQVSGSLPEDNIFMRWGAFSSQLDEDAHYIMTVLRRYQAEGAGELELGAFYRGGRYFHFRIDSKKWNQFEADILKLSLRSFSRTTVKSDRQEVKGKRRVVFLIRPDEFGQ